MSHPKKKKQRTAAGHVNVTEEVRAADDHQPSVEDLSIDVLANIFRYLGGPKSIIRQRRVSKKWKDAVKKTIVPPIYFCVDTVVKYNAMRVMAEAMPNLLLIRIGGFGWGSGHKWSDGEDRDERAAEIMSGTTRHTHDIGIISNFGKLRILEIVSFERSKGYASLNGRYPVFFSSFPLLQILRIQGCSHLKWDLEMLAGFPKLKVLECEYNYSLTGSINNLGALKDTLVKVKIYNCPRVEGNFMDLADFPHLKELDLWGAAVTGDIRVIGENDFLSLEDLGLPKGVYGGRGYELQRISDGTNLVRSVFLFKKQRPALKIKGWYVRLSEDSPDWYESVDDDEYDIYPPPFYIRFVEAGPRIGYRWETFDGRYCEVNWLDPEPESGSWEYEDYISDYQHIQGEISLYRGYYEPPTEEQYTLLYEEHLAENQSDDEDD